MQGLEALTGLQEGPKNPLPDGTLYEYDSVLKRTVEITPSGERFPVTLVDGKLQRDSQKADERKGRPPRMLYKYKGFWGCDSCCDIEVHRRSDGKHVFIATEVPENRGTPITNYALSLPAIRLSPRPPIGFLRQAPSSVLLHSACQARH